MRTMKYKVLVTAEHIRSRIDRYKGFFVENDIDVVIPEKDRLTESELIPIIHEYDGVVTVADQFTPAVLDRAKRLKVISKWGTGIDTIDRDYAKKLGIKIFYTPGAFTVPVSDTTLGLILCFARNIKGLDKEVREGKWDKYEIPTLEELSLGIIGLGRIGIEVARKARVFGMKIYGNDIREILEEVLEEHGITLATKDEIYETCDFISLHTDLNETSRHLINQRAFSKMKPTAVLINTSRGAVVNTDDLIGALEEKRIRGAGLDVFETEPLPMDSPLRKFENCILSPHNANSSFRYWERVHENTLNNLLIGLQNGR